MLTQEEVAQRVRDVIRRRHLAWSTERTYCGWIARYYAFAARLPRGLAHERKMEAFLTHLARDGDVAASTQNQAFDAIRFLYVDVLRWPLGEVHALRAKASVNARHCPSRDEVRSLLAALVDTETIPARLAARILYGAGLRLNELLELRLKDIRLADSHFVIREPKHGHDRLAKIPCSVVPDLRRQMAHAQRVFELDQERRPPLPLEIPHGLARKYPRSPHTAGWAFLFPSLGPQRHPRTGQFVRWHLRDREIQRAFGRACAGARLLAPVTPHCLRHAYGTHFAGDLRDLQELLGHKSLETTALYRHPSIDRAPSPLDTLASG